MYMPANGWTKT